jgi:hypothetical protein
LNTSILTIRLPRGKHARLRILARTRGVSINKLMDELATVAISNHDTESRFRARAARGRRRKGLALLRKLDRAFSQRQQ